MSSFPVDLYVPKLRKLVPSQEAIETLSHWMIHFKRFIPQVVYYWNYEMKASHIFHQMTLLYLANDVIQNTRKKTGKFIAEFSNVLPERIDALYRKATPKLREKISRMIGIWQERNIFSSHLMDELLKIMKRSNEEVTKHLPSFLTKPSQLDALVNLLQKFRNDISRNEAKLTTFLRFSDVRNVAELENICRPLLEHRTELLKLLTDCCGEQQETIQELIALISNKEC